MTRNTQSPSLTHGTIQSLVTDFILTISWGPGAYRKAATKDIRARISVELFRMKFNVALKPRPSRMARTLSVSKGLDRRVTFEWSAFFS